MNTNNSFWEDDAQPDLTISQNYNKQSSSFWDNDVQPDLTTLSNNKVVTQSKSVQSKHVQAPNQQPVVQPQAELNQPYFRSASDSTKVYNPLSQKLKNIKNNIDNAGRNTSTALANAASNTGHFLSDFGKATWNGFADESILGANALTGLKNKALDKVGLANWHRPTEEIKAEREMYFPKFKLNEDAVVANTLGDMLGWAPSFALGGEALAAAKTGAIAARTGKAYNTVKRAQKINNIRRAKQIAAGQIPKDNVLKKIFKAANHSGQDMAMFEGGRNMLSRFAGDNPQDSLLKSAAKGYGMGAAFGTAFAGAPMAIKGTYNLGKSGLNWVGNTPIAKSISNKVGEVAGNLGAKIADSALAKSPVTATIANAINYKAPIGSTLRKYQDLSNILSDRSSYDITMEELAKATEGMDDIQAIEWLARMEGKTPEEIATTLQENSKIADKVDYLNKVEKAIDNKRPLTREELGLPEETNTQEPTQDVIDNVQRMNEYVASRPSSMVQQVLKGKKEFTPEEYEKLVRELETDGDLADDALQFILDNGVKIRENASAPKASFESLKVDPKNKAEAPKEVKEYNEREQQVQKPEYYPNPADDVNLFEQARDYDVPQTDVGYAPTIVQPKVSIPKIKPNTKKTLAEWKSKYSTKDVPQEVNSPIKSSEGINTPKEVETPQNESSVRPQTKIVNHGTPKVRVTENGWAEHYNEDGTIHFRHKVKKVTKPERKVSEVNMGEQYGSTNEIKPSKVSHSETYDTSTPEYKGIEGTEGYKVTRLKPGKAEGSDYKPQRNTSGAEPNYYEGVEEGRYTEKELRDAYGEDIRENLELDNADIENRQRFFDKERMDEYGEEYNGKEETGTAYEEGYERGEYGEAENVAENEAEIYKNASEEFKQFWKEYKDLPKGEKTNYIRQHVKDMSFKDRRKFQNELVQQEDFLARKYKPKRAGDEYTDEYNYYDEGGDTRTFADATKSHNSNRAEQVYGDSLEVRENANIKRISSEKQNNKSIYEANRFMSGKRWGKPSDNSAVTNTLGKFNINHGEAQKVYDRTLNAIKSSKLNTTSREHALKVLNKAAEKFNNAHPNKTIDIKLDADIRPTSAETLLENANKSGDLSAGYNILKYNKKLKSTDLGEEHYRQSQDKMLNETLPKLKEELSDLENDLARATDPAQRELLQYKVDKKKIEMHEQAMERGQQGINYYRNFDRDKAEMSSYNRNTGKYEKKGVSWDRHSEGLRQPEYEAVKNELESYSLRDYELEKAKQRVADYERKNRTIEFDENISDEDFVKLVTENPSAIRERMDSLPKDKQQKVVATIYNKALTTGKGLAIVRGKSTTIGQVAESGNKAFKELLEQHPELKDAKVSTIPKGKSGIDIDTNEMFFSESSIKSNTLDHEILHIKDNQTPEGHALLIDLANKKQSVLDYVHNPDNKPTIDKAINLIGERNFSNNTKLYSFLRKNGFNSDEMDIIKGYKKLDSEVKNHYMEQRAQRVERGEDVSNINKELAEMEKTSQIRHRQLQRTIESTKSKNGILGLRNGRNGQNSESVKNRRRLVAQEDSFINDLKDTKFDSNGVPEDKKIVTEALGTKYNDYSKFVDDAVNKPENISKSSEDLGKEWRFFTPEQAANRLEQQHGGYYYKAVKKSRKKGFLQSGDALESGREKEGLFGRKTIEGKPDITKLDTKKSILRTAKEYFDRKQTNDVMKFNEDNFAVKIGENGELPKDYVPVNKYVLATAFHEGYGREWMEAIMKGDDAIDVLYKNSPGGVADSFKTLRKYWTKETDYHYGLPKKVINFMLDEHGEVSELYKERYLSGDYRGVQGSKTKFYLKRFGELNDIFLDAFKRGVLSSASFFVNNRFGNQMMLAARADNPIEYIKSFFEAGKIKSSEVPIELKENVVAEAFGGSQKARVITGNEFIDTLAAMTRGEFVGLENTYNHAIKKGVDKVNYKVLDGLTVPKDSTMVKIPTLKTLAVAAGDVGIAAPNKLLNTIGKGIQKANDMAENFERRQAMYIARNKISKATIDKTSKVAMQAYSLPAMLELCRTNPEYRTAAISAVEDMLGNYRSFNKIERKVFKRMVPFYSWYRTMARHEYQLFKEDPVRWGLIHYELAQFKKDNKKRVDYQRDALATPMFDKHGDRLLVNKGGQVPYNTYTELWENLAENKSTLGGANPLLTVTKDAISGKHDFLGMEITDRKYARRYSKKNNGYEFVNTEDGKVVGDKLPLGARLNYMRKQLVDSTLYPMLRSPLVQPSYYYYGLKNKLSKDKNNPNAGKWVTPDKYYDTGYGGYSDGDRYKGGRRKAITALGEREKALNKYLGTTLARERIEAKENKSKKINAWRAKHKKK